MAGLEDQIAGLGEDLFLPQQRPQLALEHETVLILSGMAVQRTGQYVRRHGVLDEREAAARFLAVDHEPVSTGARRPHDHSVLRALVGRFDPATLPALAARYGADVDFERTLSIVERHRLKS